jgi:N-methylhydantoinase B
MRIVPTRICERGRMNEAFLDLLFANMRIAHERRGDFNTMLGTSRKAAEHLQRLFSRFGGAVLLETVDELIARSALVMRSRIAEVPDGDYFAEGYLDSNGHSDEPLLGRLKLTIDGERLIADFTGSSPQTMGPTNVGPAMAFNAVATMVKAFLDPHTAVNHGSFQPIEIVNPKGSFLNATLPAPCGGMVECRSLMGGLVASALGQALPERRVGDLKGGANHVYLSGPTRDGGMFLMYEYPAGGTGATRRSDGNHGTRAYTEGDFNAVWSAEIVEAQCPVQVSHYGIRDGSCGDGEFRGGCGIRRDLRVLDSGASLSVLADKCVIPPYGVAAGWGGAANRFVVQRNGETIEPSPVPGKVGGFALAQGDVVRIETAGGGGYGDPLDRDLNRVRQDVAQQYLSAEQVRRRYGVALGADGVADQAATRAERERQRSARVFVALQVVEQDEHDGPRRCIRISPEIAGRLEVSEGALVELTTDTCGSALRGWVCIDARVNGVPLGPRGIGVLGGRQGSLVEIRAVPGMRA